MLKIVVESCPVCNSAEAREYSAFPELVFSECGHCGAIYRSAEDLDKLKEHYTEEHFTGNGDGSMRYGERFERRARKAEGEILQALEVLEGPANKLLDVGCSMGYALEAAKRLELEAVGVDTSEFAVNECHKRGYTAEVGDITNTGSPTAPLTS